MADTNETIADIRKDAEAKFRELVEAYMQRRAAFQTTVGAMQAFNTVFDRLEAAHKRECGDMAKLREAMKHIKDRLPHMLQYMRVHWEDASSGGYFDELMLVIDAALSVPPRNCDRFATADEAIGAYRQTHRYMVVNVFLDWLFAPATEKEGGAK